MVSMLSQPQRVSKIQFEIIHKNFIFKNVFEIMDSNMLAILLQTQCINQVNHKLSKLAILKYSYVISRLQITKVSSLRLYDAYMHH